MEIGKLYIIQEQYLFFDNLQKISEGSIVMLIYYNIKYDRCKFKVLYGTRVFERMVHYMNFDVLDRILIKL